MEASDLHLIETLSTSNPELPRLLKRHREFEAALSSMDGRSWLSPAEQIEVRRLKRMKLAGRDRMERILAEHRASV